MHGCMNVKLTSDWDCQNKCIFSHLQAALTSLCCLHFKPLELCTVMESIPFALCTTERSVLLSSLLTLSEDSGWLHNTEINTSKSVAEEESSSLGKTWASPLMLAQLFLSLCKPLGLKIQCLCRRSWILNLKYCWQRQRQNLFKKGETVQFVHLLLQCALLNPWKKKTTFQSFCVC